MNIDFSGKAVLVTGGGAGIGRAICLAFAESGARVACVDRDATLGEDTVRQVRALGREAVFIQADVTDPAQVRAYVQQTVAAFGRIDVFANNAGIEGVVQPLVDYPEDDFDRVMAVNVRGVFLGLKYVLPVMKEQKSGVVINTGSTGSHVGATGVCAYTASKHAVLGLTKTVALEVAGFGIRVNAVCPGGTRTRMLQSLTDNRANVAELAFNLATPNARVAEPEEVAATVLFMASDHARHMVGQSIILDGGRLAM
jgi:NAD(P)-dependent dehydrogenase (short-subunit alcohol dehydrogenase family)